MTKVFFAFVLSSLLVTATPVAAYTTHTVEDPFYDMLTRFEMTTVDMQSKPKKSTPRPTVRPTATPTVRPTATPTVRPTATPTIRPTATPTVRPTATPTVRPTATPTVRPTATPTIRPTATPTVRPTATPTVRPTATPTIRPTATPTIRPTATPTVRPTATPTATPTLRPTATPGTIFVPVTPRPNTLQINAIQIGDRFIDLNVQGQANAYDVFVDGTYAQTISTGINRIADLIPNETVTLRVVNFGTKETITRSFRMKRQQYEERAFLHRLRPADFNQLTFAFTENVNAKYQTHFANAFTALRNVGSTPVAVKNNPFVLIDQFEPDFDCAGYMQVQSYFAPGFPSFIHVVINDAEVDSYPDFRADKVALHEMGHAIGLAHQNDGKLKVDDNIEPSIMRQGWVDWSGFQAVDRYNINWRYNQNPSVKQATVIDAQTLHADVPTLSFNELLARSDSVIVAKPVRSTSRPDRLVTDTELAVEQVIKGESVAQVAEPYYIKDGKLTTIESYTPMRVGQSYLLFLKKNRNGRYMVTGVQQGQFNLVEIKVQSLDSPYPHYPLLREQALNYWRNNQ